MDTNDAHAAAGDTAAARVYRSTADDFQRSVKGWTVTTNGPYATGRYFIRLSKTGDPNAAISYGLGNGSINADQRSVIDAGFLELVRLGAGEVVSVQRPQDTLVAEQHPLGRLTLLRGGLARACKQQSVSCLQGRQPAEARA